MFAASSVAYLLLGLLALADAGQAEQRAAPVDDEEIIMGAWTDPAKCNGDIARPASMPEIMAGNAIPDGTCVAVEGYWRGRALLARKADADDNRSTVAPSHARSRIGLYAKSELFETAPDRSRRYVMIGVLGHCETQWPGAMMVMGYCHYTDGPILLLSQAFDAGKRKK